MTTQPKDEFRVWDDYVSEAQVPDFVLKDRDGEELVRITNPTGVQVMRISQGLRNSDLDLILVGICGEAYPQVVELLGSAGHGAMPQLAEDLLQHFGFYEEYTLIGPGGGTVRESRPLKIQQLQKMGYVLQGEAQASRG